jgi:hypothetical protein
MVVLARGNPGISHGATQRVGIRRFIARPRHPVSELRVIAPVTPVLLFYDERGRESANSTNAKPEADALSDKENAAS